MVAEFGECYWCYRRLLELFYSKVFLAYLFRYFPDRHNKNETTDSGGQNKH